MAKKRKRKYIYIYRFSKMSESSFKANKKVSHQEARVTHFQLSWQLKETAFSLFLPLLVWAFFFFFFFSWSTTSSCNHFLDPTGEERNRPGVKQCCLSAPRRGACASPVCVRVRCVCVTGGFKHAALCLRVFVFSDGVYKNEPHGIKRHFSCSGVCVHTCVRVCEQKPRGSEG